MEKTRERKAPPYILGFLAIALYFVMAACFFSNTRFLLPVGDGGIDDIGFYTMALSLLALGVGIYLWARKRFFLKMDWRWLCFLSLFFLFSIVGLFSFSGYSDSSILYFPASKDVLRVFVRAFLLFVSLYFFVAVLPFLSKGSKPFVLLYWCVSLTCLFAILYSYIMERDIYLGVLLEEDFDFSHFALKSFTSNRNSYGFLLFFGIVSESLLLSKKENGFHWFLLFFYYANLFFPLSKTSLLLTWFFLLFFFVYRLIVKVRRHWFKAIFPFFLFLAVHALVAVLIFTDVGFYFGDWNIFLRNVLIPEGPSAEGWFGSFFARMNQLKESISLLIHSSTPSFLFGFGSINGASVYFASKGDPFVFVPIDSGPAMNLLEGGIFGLVFSFGLYLALFLLILKSIRFKDRNAWLSLALFVCLLARTFMEVGDLTYLSWAGMAMYAYLFVPLKAEREYKKRLSLALESESDYLSKKAKEKRKAISLLPSFFFASFLFVPFLSVFLGLSAFEIPFFSSLYNFFSVLILYFLFSFSLSLGIRCLSSKDLLRGVSFLAYGFLSSLSLCVCLPLVSELASIILASCLLGGLLVLSLVFAVWRIPLSEWLPLLYVLSFGALFVFCFSLLNAYLASLLSLYSIAGEILLVLSFYFLHAFFLSYMDFPICAQFFEQKGERLPVFLSRKKVPLDLRSLSKNEEGLY